jgi:hypothetical protein
MEEWKVLGWKDGSVEGWKDGGKFLPPSSILPIFQSLFLKY